MALISDAAITWSAPVLLANDEIWQSRWGSIFITTTETPEPEDGFALQQGQGVLFRAGLQVRYRKVGTTSAMIVREAV